MWNWECGESLSTERCLNRNRKKKTFFTHSTWSCDLSFLQFSQFGIVSVISSGWMSHKSHGNRMSHKFIEVEHFRYQKNYFKVYRLVTKTCIFLRIRFQSRLSKTKYIIKSLPFRLP